MNWRHLLLPDSLVRRLTLYYAAAFLVFLGVSFLVLYWSIGAVLDSRMDDDLEEDIEEFSEILAVSGQAGVIAEMDKEVIAGEHESVFLFLYQSSGDLVHVTDLEHWSGLAPDLALVERQFRHPESESMVSLEFPQHDSDVRIIYGSLSPDFMMIIGESNDERDDIMEILAIAFSLVFAFTLPLASVLVWLLTRQSIAGIRSVSDAAVEFMSGNHDRRVNAHNQVMEVQTLADTFDAMAVRIQKLISNMREMTDNIAHDLRSPLGRVRLLSESLLHSTPTEAQYISTAEDTIAECDRLIKMINISLDVAETEAGVTHGHKDEFDMTALVDDACDLFESVAEQKGIKLDRKLDPPCQLKGDVNSVQRMLANLLDNAVKYTPQGGHISVEMCVTDEMLEVNVTDSGIGIDQPDHESIFNRFYRVEPSRSASGCGLGLSYSRAVARAHGGDITVVSKMNQGSTFTIFLPRTVSAARSPEFSLAAAG